MSPHIPSPPHPLDLQYMLTSLAAGKNILLEVILVIWFRVNFWYGRYKFKIILCMLFQLICKCRCAPYATIKDNEPQNVEQL